MNDVLNVLIGHKLELFKHAIQFKSLLGGLSSPTKIFFQNNVLPDTHNNCPKGCMKFLQTIYLIFPSIPLSRIFTLKSSTTCVCIATLVKSGSRLVAKKSLESHNKFDNAPNLHYATLIENTI